MDLAPWGVRILSCTPPALENADSTIEQRYHNFSIGEERGQSYHNKWWENAKGPSTYVPGPFKEEDE